MNVSAIEERDAKVTQVAVTDDALTAELADGRTISGPLTWYPRLVHATLAERNNWRLIGDGEGIHWADLDEDISVNNLMTGQPSGESRRSFERWLKAKKEGRGLTLYELRQAEQDDAAAG